MIEAPKWAKGARPTPKGWMRGNELLKSQKISQADIDAWNESRNPKKVVPVKAKVEPPKPVEPVEPVEPEDETDGETTSYIKSFF